MSQKNIKILVERLEQLTGKKVVLKEYANKKTVKENLDVSSDDKILLDCEEGGIMTLKQLIVDNSEPDVEPIDEEAINWIRELKKGETAYIGTNRITKI